MKPATYPKLLKDLQKLQKRLVTAYAADLRAHPARMDWLRERWQAAEVGGRIDDYLDVCARRSAVQFLLRTVYVRVLEDLGALTPPRIRGQWGLAAFKDVAPALGLRGYLSWVFRDLAKDFPALFTPGPDELPLPAEDQVREVWELWHAEDGQGGLLYDWQADDGTAADFDSRFLGDLYQDLDAEVRKRFALLQTPVFVEEYILDHTLTPALAEFDPAALRANGETFRLIDPTCGSGHFLIGAFHRLADWWGGQHGLDKWEAAARALESVWGADLNPHAVDIARFRLLLEVRARTGVTDLDRLAAVPLNLAVMDTLIPWERLERAPELFPERDRLAKYATAAERKANAAFLDRDFHVVVGNPPYIASKDNGKSDDYRIFWPDSAFNRYSLSAPFLERFLVLGHHAAFMGVINANNFLKRQFGRMVIEKVVPRFDLIGIVDTSGAYIPGHGTPTVILFARCRPPVNSEVYAILGKRGEPARPRVPEYGQVWTSIRTRKREENDEDPFVTSTFLPRSALSLHPWSLRGGGAPELKQHIEEAADGVLSTMEFGGTGKIHRPSFGNMSLVLLDDVYFGASPDAARDLQCHHCGLLEGAYARDYAVEGCQTVLYPYVAGSSETLELPACSPAFRHFWRFRSLLEKRRGTGLRTNEERGLPFYAFPFYAPLTYSEQVITYPEVATHNHYVLDSAHRLYKNTAPTIRLHPNASFEENLDLLGLLNSSVLEFWQKQVFHNKGYGASGDGARTTAQDWENFYQRESTKLKKAPITFSLRDERVALTRALHSAAEERAACLPGAVFAGDWSASELADRLADARARHGALTHRLVALQEELDWLTYGSYGLLAELDDAPTTVGPDAVEPLSPGHRPFEILAARADEDAPPEEKSAWWTRHGHPKVTEIPAHYSPAHRARLQARIDAIEADDKLQLLESFPFKRRWQLPDLDDEAKKAARAWLLDRLEDLFADGGPLATPRPYRLEAIVAAWTADPRVAAAAAVAEGSADLDLTLVAEKLLAAESLPDNPRRVFTSSGLRKLDQWKAVWALQDREDAGETGLTIDKPPELVREDFVRPEYFSVRGKLNVPRERFIAFADLAPPRYGWNGWRDLDRGLAQVEAFTEAEGDPHDPLPPPTHDDPRRCGVTLGLWESLDDVRRWNGAEAHGELQALAHEACRQTACPCDLVKRWQGWVNGEFQVAAQQAAEQAEVTVEDRAALAELLRRYGTTGASVRELARASGIAVPRLQVVLDDLVASGDAAVSGRGLRRMYALPQAAQPQQKLF